MPTSPSLFSSIIAWFSDHFNIAGWVSLILFGLRTSWKASRFVSGLDKRATAVEDTVTTIRDNHLRHIQSGIESLNTKMDSQTDAIVGELRSLQNNLTTVVLSKKD